MENREFIEYCEEDTKFELKPIKDQLLGNFTREYFEEDIKTEIVEEKFLKPIKNFCKICRKEYKTKGTLATRSKVLLRSM